MDARLLPDYVSTFNTYKDVVTVCPEIPRRGAESYDEAHCESLSKGAEEPENAGGLDMIKSDLKRLRDDPDEARREELDHGELARRGGAMAKSVLPG